MSKDISIPKHVAVIMDGNGRWAQSRCLPRVEGHRKGVEALERVVEAAAQRGVKTLTVFAFSSENWRRPAAEVTALMKLFCPRTGALAQTFVRGRRSSARNWRPYGL